MQFFTDIQEAIHDYFNAVSFIKKHHLQKLFVASLLFYLVIILLSAFLIWIGMDATINFILSISWIKQFSDFTNSHSWIVTIAKIGFYISSFFLFISFYKYLFLAISSPMYAYISERTAEILTHQQFLFNAKQFTKDIVRGILLSGRNFLKQLLLTVVLFLLSFIPIVGWLFSLIILIIDTYYYGFSMLDYNAEREKLSAKESRLLIKNRRGLAIGNGLIMYFSFLIPIIGVVFVAPLSAIAATLTFHKHLKNN